MSRSFQDSTIEFLYEPIGKSAPIGQPHGLVVYAYGGTLERCIENARERFNLDADWKVVECKKP